MAGKTPKPPTPAQASKAASVLASDSSTPAQKSAAAKILGRAN